MIRRPPRSTHCISSAASDVYKRQRVYMSWAERPCLLLHAPTTRSSFLLQTSSPTRYRWHERQRQINRISTAASHRRAQSRHRACAELPESSGGYPCLWCVCVFVCESTWSSQCACVSGFIRLCAGTHPNPAHSGDGDPEQTIPPQSPHAHPRCSCCLLYTSPSPRDKRQSRMPSSA